MLNKKSIIILFLIFLSGSVYAYRIQQPIRYELPWTKEQVKELNNTLDGLFLSQQGRYETDIVTSSKTNARNGEAWILSESGTHYYEFKAGDNIYRLTGGGGDMFKSVYDTNSNNIVDTATALAANGANCSAGQSPLGVDASGAVEGCWTPSSGGTPGGADTNVQFKDGTDFGGDSGFTYDKTYSSVAIGREVTLGYVGANGIGSLVVGYSSVEGNVASNGSASFTAGYATGDGSNLAANGEGSVAIGKAINTGNIAANGIGSLAVGYCDSTTDNYDTNIQANADGSIAYGYVLSEASVYSEGKGALAGGYASGHDASITAAADGSVALGYAEGADSTITAASHGSVSAGYAINGGSVTAIGVGATAFGVADGAYLYAEGTAAFSTGQNTQAVANNSMALGKNITNTTTNTLMIGFAASPGTTTPSFSVDATTVTVSGTFRSPLNAAISGTVTACFNTSGQLVKSTVACNGY
jgi:hypothetical protein